jgi:hypothetical protein
MKARGQFFTYLQKLIKKLFIVDDDVDNDEDEKSVFTLDNLEDYTLDITEVNNTIENIISLCKYDYIESFEAGIHVFYDMSFHEQFLPYICRMEIIDVIEKITSKESSIYDNIKHSTIMFLGKLVDTNLGKEVIMKHPTILSTLEKNATEKDYTTIHFHRECSRIVNLCRNYRYNNV